MWRASPSQLQTTARTDYGPPPPRAVCPEFGPVYAPPPARLAGFGVDPSDRVLARLLAWQLRHLSAPVPPKALANVAWSLAVLGIADGPLLEAIAGAAREGLGALRQQDLANIAWALGTLRLDDEPLLSALAFEARCVRRIREPESAVRRKGACRLVYVGQ